MRQVSSRAFGWSFAVTLAVVAMAASGCSDDSGSFAEVGSAEINVTPTEVVFPGIAIGEVTSSAVQVSNVGTSTLIIEGWGWEGDATDFSVEGLDGIQLAAGETIFVNITYAPTDAGLDDAFLVIESNASNGREVRVHVLSTGQSAQLAANPSSVDLAAEAIGEAVSQNIQIYNVGNEAFQIGGINLVTATSELALSNLPTDLPRTIGPNDTLDFTLTYTPTGGGNDIAEVQLLCDAENCVDGSYFIPVNATMLTPYLIVSPASISFGAVPIGETVTANLLARNQGESNLDISAIEFAFNPDDMDGEIVVQSVAEIPYDPADPSAVIAPGESAVITLAYTPIDADVDSETLLIRSNDPEFPVTQIPVGGSAAVPALEVFPTELNFPRTAVPGTSRLDLVIRNGGTEDLQLAGIEQRGDSAFTPVNTADLPASLGPGQQFTLAVTFTPPEPLSNFSGSLIISAPNDPDSPEALVPMIGASDAEPTCELSVVPVTINFGTVPRGTAREGTATFTNTGSGGCRITRVQKQANLFGFIFSDYFTVDSVSPFMPTPASPLVLEPGEQMVVTATYFPRTLTPLGETFGDTGSVEVLVQDDVSGDTVTCGRTLGSLFPPPPERDCGVNLQARSAIADIGTVPSNIDFGLTTIGCNSQDEEVRIYNTGTAPVDVTDVYLEDCSMEFQLAGVPVLPTTIPAGSFTAVQLRYRPTGVGEDACRLVIESDSETARLTVPLRGEGTTSSRQIDEFEQVSGREVDVLFVVDNSGSMSEEQSNLADNFSSFIAAATTWGSEFQIGIVTTQIEGSIDDPTGGSREPGQLLGSPRIITPDTPSFQSVFQRTVEVGTGDPGTQESGLESARLALSDPVATDLALGCDMCEEPYMCIEGANGSEALCGGYNRTFLRDSASLEIVFVSDEEDQSRPTLEFYEDFFRNIKGFRNDALFHTSAIVGPRGGCSTSNGEADAGNRYIDLAEATGGIVGSICDANFAASLEEIGTRAFGLREQFFLSRVPDPATIEVRVEGTPTPTGWSYDEESNSLIWDEGSAPEPGTDFEAEYEARCF